MIRRWWALAVLVAFGAMSCLVSAPQAQAAPTVKTKTHVWHFRADAVGDSVMLGAQPNLYQAGVVAYAQESRQWSAGIAVVQWLIATGHLSKTVVIHLGTNGPITNADFDAMMRALTPATRVVFLTVKEPRFWEAENNAVIVAGVHRYKKARLVDWHAIASANPAYLYPGDGIHLTPAGAAGYAQAVLSALK